MRYQGGKGAAGVAQQIISLMPRHDLYVEPFLGGGRVLYVKRPARLSIAADIDASVIKLHRILENRSPFVDYMVADAFKLLPKIDFSRQPSLVYLDPPYHPATRGGRRYYRHELDADGHRRLLRLAMQLNTNVMISGYRCDLYDRLLWSWGRHDFKAMTRGGPRVESVWFNFTPGQSYHDTRFIGRDFRERERIKRKRARWCSRFSAMPAAERAVILEAIEDAAARSSSPAPELLKERTAGRGGEVLA